MEQPPMDSSLIIVSLSATTDEELRVQRFAEWMGVKTRNVVLDSGADPFGQLELELATGCRWAMSANGLRDIHRASSDLERLGRFFEKSCAALLVFGWNERSGHDAALSWLTKGRVERVLSSPEPSGSEDVFHFPSAGRAWSLQFAGLRFSPSRREALATFELSANASESATILLANGKPAFLCIGAPGCRKMFLIAGPETPDIDQPLSREKGIEESYGQIIPFLISIRDGFGDYSWHGVEKTARFIIDDPLLADRYGCLDYGTLFDSMERQDFGTSIAFIPWNYRRTSRRWAEKFIRKKANLSVCIHGCDHSNREFSSQDAATLVYKAGLSVARMEKHQQRTRLPFEKVMVFPQGYFSKAAIPALRSNEYLAAVNTTCFPTDCSAGELTIGDFLRPAITRFGGFPVFRRHYPRRLIDLAFDIFLGKPAFIVEHHPYVGDGCAQLESFVRELERVEPDLSWPTLSSQIERSCLMRRCDDGSFAVKFFTRKFVLRNEQSAKSRFVLEKDEPDVSIVRSVLIDGRTVPFSSKEISIQFEVEMEAGQVRQIEVLDQPIEHLPIQRLGMRYRFGVLFRRELSEFRDNTLSRHPGMLKTAKKIASRLKMTGNHRRDRNP
jgi:hypothetical protein